jgi:DNA-binding NarL/FixJ family response regulator
MTRIAIVEDHQVIRESLIAYAQTDPECCCIWSGANAEEALRALPALQPDIVLMDIQLPEMSGIDCTTRLKELLPAAQVIMVTVYGDPDLIFKALRAGACGYLLKRCTPQELVAAIREVREGGVPMSREIARKVISFFKEPLPPSAPKEPALGLSPREQEILELLALGCADKQIAEKIGVKNGTVRWHLQHVYEKLHVRSRTEAVLRYQQARGAG